MRDEQLNHQKRVTRSVNQTTADYPLPTRFKTAPPIKRLSWDEMQKRRAHGLCFNCEEKFTPGHRCRGPQLLLLEGCCEYPNGDDTESSMEFQPEISLHAHIKPCGCWQKLGPMRWLFSLIAGILIILSVKRWLICCNYQ